MKYSEKSRKSSHGRSWNQQMFSAIFAWKTIKYEKLFDSLSKSFSLDEYFWWQNNSGFIWIHTKYIRLRTENPVCVRVCVCVCVCVCVLSKLSLMSAVDNQCTQRHLGSHASLVSDSWKGEVFPQKDKRLVVFRARLHTLRLSIFTGHSLWNMLSLTKH